MSVFTTEQRERLRAELVAAAKDDPNLCGAAHTGSAATERLDRWSDVDLALCLKPEAPQGQVIAEWTARMYQRHDAVAHQDVMRGTTLFRVFLLKNTLQVDIAFWSAAEFGPVGPNFKLIYGQTKPAQAAPEVNINDLVGMAWLYALHVRSSLARGRFLQAEYMLSGMRNNVLALACVRCGVNADQGRGLDDLPHEEKTRAIDCLPRSLEAEELARAFRVTMEGLVGEIERANAGKAAGLRTTLRAMCSRAGLGQLLHLAYALTINGCPSFVGFEG